jgi:hypothetical protein
MQESSEASNSIYHIFNTGRLFEQNNYMNFILASAQN